MATLSFLFMFSPSCRGSLSLDKGRTSLARSAGGAVAGARSQAALVRPTFFSAR
ncbi:hypothetical protein D3C78_692870 [compost metagenome]